VGLSPWFLGKITVALSSPILNKGPPAHFENANQTVQWAKEKLSIPVLAISSQYFMKEEPLRQMQNVAKNVEYVELERCGHSMALEQPEKLAEVMLKFISGLQRAACSWRSASTKRSAQRARRT
jgi:pimeloyl-ACP methyl ester carboxylesterase